MSANSSSYSSSESYNFRVCISIFTALFVGYILLLPLFIFVVYLSCQRWSKQRSVTMVSTISHSDVFTFNMVVLELISLLADCVYCYGAYTDKFALIVAGMGLFSVVSPGQTLFHLLTCVERYLAVVRPVTYMGLKQSGGVRIRNVSIVCVWLLCVGSLGISMHSAVYATTFGFSLLGSSFIVISFCSFSILHVLIRPGPGEVCGNKERIDQSKQRAFQMTTAILGALSLRFLSNLVYAAMYSSSALGPGDTCVVLWSLLWFCLPSSLVLPLLFLQRAGKLPGCKHNPGSA